MKCQIPQISWHSRSPVLSIDFQPFDGNKLRLATGGIDSHVLIWYLTLHQETKSVCPEIAADLKNHNASVNVVRFSPKGDQLASGDDEGTLFIWKLRDDSPTTSLNEDINNQEEWYVFKILRGHLEDIYDISWSADSKFLVSGSLDNTAIMWDMENFKKVHIFPDSKGYIQGVSFDPLNLYVATIGTDRVLRIIDVNVKKTAFKIAKAPWSITNNKGTLRASLFHNETLKSYFRRLSFTPDGKLLIVPSGIFVKDGNFLNVTYIFSRHALDKPVAYLPTGDKSAIAVKCNPRLYKLRQSGDKNCILNLPYRMVFSVASTQMIIIYDTEQLIPIACISNIHYTNLTDMTWSDNGKILAVSSSDGYCSFIVFDEELGEQYDVPKIDGIKVTN